MGKRSKQKATGNPLQARKGKDISAIPSSKEPLSDNSDLTVVSRDNYFFMIATVLLVSFAVYFNALSNGFVYDDVLQVLGNPWIRDIRYIPDIFSRSAGGFLSEHATTNFYRPLMHVIYMLTYYVFGLEAWGFHLVNIFFHAGNALMVLVISARLIRESHSVESRHLHSLFLSVPFISALLFATHPIHTEVVAWVGAIPDLSCTFFFLLSFHFYIKSGTQISSREYIFSLTFFLISLLCKEPAVTLPIVLILYDFTFKTSRQHLYGYFKRYAPFFLVLAFYFLVRFSVLGSFSPVKTHTEFSAYQYVINVISLIAQYIKLLVLPNNLNAYYTIRPLTLQLDFKGILSFTVIVACIISGVIALRKNRNVFFGMALIAVPLLPVLYIPALGESPLAERYLYLPSVGFVLIVALFFAWLREKLFRYDFAMIAVVILIVGWYSGQTISRNRVWKDNLSLFTDTARKSPDGDLPNGMLGYALMQAGRFDEAIQQFRVALKLNPGSAFHHFNLGLTLMKKNLPAQAIPELQRGLVLDPKNILARRYLADAYAMSGMEDEAVDEWKRILAIDPNHVESRNNLASVFMKSGRLDEAIQHLTVVVRIQPGNPDSHNSLGIAYGQKGLLDNAIEEFETAIRLAPAEPSYRSNLERATKFKAE